MNPTRTCAARPNGPYGIDAKSKCRQPVHRSTAALCSKHEKQWRIESKRRSAARRAAAADAVVRDANEQHADDTRGTFGPSDDSLTARNQRALKATRAAVAA